jgi:hypothetical protein
MTEFEDYLQKYGKYYELQVHLRDELEDIGLIENYSEDQNIGYLVALMINKLQVPNLDGTKRWIDNQLRAMLKEKYIRETADSEADE